MFGLLPMLSAPPLAQVEINLKRFVPALFKEQQLRFVLFH
jgi:hypothetical protein